MFKHYLARVQDVEIYPIISIIIFFTFFVGLLWWVFRSDKKYINKMSNLPLEDNNQNLHQELKL